MRLYRAMLWLYPASFRREYGAELRATFAAGRRARSGAVAVAAFWLAAIADVVTNAAAAHADMLWQDVRHVGRLVRRSPGFVVTMLAIVGLGVGATTAAFSVTDQTLFKPLPFPESDRLVRVWETRKGYGQMELSPANFRDWRARQRTLAGFDVFSGRSANLTGEGEPMRLDGAAVGATLFDVLGVTPARGRGFLPAEAVPGGPSVVVLSHGLWQARFGGSDAILGRTVRLDGVPHQIVGVMPATFAFPDRDAQYWRPLRLDEDAYRDRNDNYLMGVGRLAPGASVELAQRDLSRVAAELEVEHPTENAQAGASTYLMREGYSDRSRTLVVALVGAAACLLAITCVTLVNLLMARLLGRQRELAVRAAMGAGRERLVRQFLTETLSLALCGGAIGVVVAMLAVPLFGRLVPTNLPFASGPTVDWRVLTFAAMITLATGLATGLLPWLGARRSNFDALRGGRSGVAQERLRGALVTVSLIASVVLLVGAGLLFRALWKVQSVPPGFVADGVLTVRTALPMPKYEAVDRRLRWYDEVLTAVSAQPGVEAAAFISFLPMTMKGGIWPVGMGGSGTAREEGQVASLRFVTQGFFDAMRIPFHAGRDVSRTDTAGQPFVAVVSQSFAEHYWPGQSAIGRRFTFAFAEREVVGVVGDVRVRGFESPSEPQVYLPAGQVADGAIQFYVPRELVIRASGDLSRLVPAVRAAVRQADPEQPVSHVRPMTDVVAAETSTRASQLTAVGTFGAAALVLASVGIYGLLSFAVSQRTREFGLRLALGATRTGVLAMVLRRAARLAGVAVALGTVGAYWTGRTLEAALAGVPPADPATIAAVAGLVALVALVSAVQPAVRATRVDPMTAMRSE